VNKPTEDKPAIPAITHGTKEVCVASNNDWLDHLYITLHYQNRALVIWSMILLLAAEFLKQGRLMKLTIGTIHLFLRALLSGKTGSAAAKQHQKKSENKYHPELVFCSEQTSTFLKKNLDRIPCIITKLLIL